MAEETQRLDEVWPPAPIIPDPGPVLDEGQALRLAMPFRVRYGATTITGKDGVVEVRTLNPARVIWLTLFCVMQAAAAFPILWPVSLLSPHIGGFWEPIALMLMVWAAAATIAVAVRIAWAKPARGLYFYRRIVFDLTVHKIRRSKSFLGETVGSTFAEAGTFGVEQRGRLHMATLTMHDGVFVVGLTRRADDARAVANLLAELWQSSEPSGEMRPIVRHFGAIRTVRTPKSLVVSYGSMTGDWDGSFEFVGLYLFMKMIIDAPSLFSANPYAANRGWTDEIKVPAMLLTWAVLSRLGTRLMRGSGTLTFDLGEGRLHAGRRTVNLSEIDSVRIVSWPPKWKSVVLEMERGAGLSSGGRARSNRPTTSVVRSRPRSTYRSRKAGRSASATAAII